MGLDDLTKQDYAEAEAAIVKFRKSKKTRRDQDILYDALTNVGLSSEYADEYVSMEMEEN